MIFTTHLKAVDPTDGNVKTFCGPNITALSWSDAENKVMTEGMGYLIIDGIFEGQIDQDTGNVDDFNFHLN